MCCRYIVFVLMIQLFPLCLFAQDMITGRVLNEDGQGLEQVTIAFDHGEAVLSESNGIFRILLGPNQPFVNVTFSCIGYEQKKVKLYKGERDVQIFLKDQVNELETLMVRPSKYGRVRDYAAQTVTLNSFEIVTNPSAMGDVLSGLKITPGVQQNENDGRLIIHGGSPEESNLYLDGLLLFNPYTLQPKNSEVRSRFSPDLFRGVVLYSGGYSAQYGNAMSGVLQLNSLSPQEMKPKMDINLSSIGPEVSVITKHRAHSSRTSVGYQNMALYTEVIGGKSSRFHHYDQVQVDHFSQLILPHRGLLKSYLNGSLSSVKFDQKRINAMLNGSRLKEQYLYGYTVFTQPLNPKWSLYLGCSFGIDHIRGNSLQETMDKVSSKRFDCQGKIELKYYNESFTNRMGLENVHTDLESRYTLSRSYQALWQNELPAFYDEVGWSHGPLNLNVGLRAEYSSLLNSYNLAPRLYVGYQLDVHNILSLTGGIYHQMPDDYVLRYTCRLPFRKAQVATVSYNFSKGLSKLQGDLFYKRYTHLSTYNLADGQPVAFGDLGYGTAKGVSLFWRNQWGDLDYWLTYSYTDTQILSNNASFLHAPSYNSKHVFNMTAKYWFASLHSLWGMSFFIDSGATYYDQFYNPSSSKTTAARTRFDLSWSYLPKDNIIIHLGCRNILGCKNIYGYEYSEASVRPIVPSDTPFIFIGLFITLGNTHNNQLNSL